MRSDVRTCLTLAVTLIFLVYCLFAVQPAKKVGPSPSGPTPAPCPGLALGHHGATVQVLSDMDDLAGLATTCFLLPRRTYPQRSHCLRLPAEKCDWGTVIDRCYFPGYCPPSFWQHSVTLNAVGLRSGLLIDSQAVCCH
jgi:hypothetical protein